MPRIASAIRAHEDALLSAWLKAQTGHGIRSEIIREPELRLQCKEFLNLFADALAHQPGDDIYAEGWTALRDFLSGLSRSRGLQGFQPSETVNFILSVKKPIVAILRDDLGGDKAALYDETNRLHTIIDQLGVFTTEAYQKGREEVIHRQQQEMLELSTPVVKLWDGVLALPLIGTLDSQRTSVVMETLLQRIVDTGSAVAIIDITGVPTVDTLVAQHLIKTVAAARLMGAECIVSGVRPQIAQTIVHLGVDLSSITTKATLADAFAVALRHAGLAVVQKP